jgi:hypothetical protein
MSPPLPSLVNLSLVYWTAAPDPVAKFRLPAAADWAEGVDMFRHEVNGGTLADRVDLVDDELGCVIATAYPEGDNDIKIVFPWEQTQPQLA